MEVTGRAHRSVLPIGEGLRGPRSISGRHEGAGTGGAFFRNSGHCCGQCPIHGIVNDATYRAILGGNCSDITGAAAQAECRGQARAGCCATHPTGIPDCHANSTGTEAGAKACASHQQAGDCTSRLITANTRCTR